jgi:ATP-dependent DNA helicase RecQ
VKGGSSASSAKKAAFRSFSEDDEALFASLKQLRLRLANERDVPADVIFSDKSFEDMVARKPTTRTELLLFHGVGKCKEVRLAGYFLAEIQAQTSRILGA